MKIVLVVLGFVGFLDTIHGEERSVPNTAKAEVDCKIVEDIMQFQEIQKLTCNFTMPADCSFELVDQGGIYSYSYRQNANGSLGRCETKLECDDIYWSNGEAWCNRLSAPSSPF